MISHVSKSFFRCADDPQATIRVQEVTDLITAELRGIISWAYTIEGGQMLNRTDHVDVSTAERTLKTFSERVGAIREQLHKVVIGQDTVMDLLLTCALTGSHALLVGVPGLA